MLSELDHKALSWKLTCWNNQKPSLHTENSMLARKRLGQHAGALPSWEHFPEEWNETAQKELYLLISHLWTLLRIFRRRLNITSATTIACGLCKALEQTTKWSGMFRYRIQWMILKLYSWRGKKPTQWAINSLILSYTIYELHMHKEQPQVCWYNYFQ